MSRSRRKRTYRARRAAAERRRQYLERMLGTPVSRSRMQAIDRWCDQQRVESFRWRQPELKVDERSWPIPWPMQPARFIPSVVY